MTKIIEVGKIKLVLFLFVLITFCFNGYSQQQIEISFCDKMNDMRGLQAMRIIELADTIVFPSIGNGLFLNPFNLCGKPRNYNRSDTSMVIVIFESSSYSYEFKLFKKDLFCPKLDVCVYSVSRKEFRSSYTNCASYGFTGPVERKRKKIEQSSNYIPH